MKEFSLKNAKVGSKCRVSRCLAATERDVYRLQEMGLCPGAVLTILRKTSLFGALELAIKGSRLCIAFDLAQEFLVVESKSGGARY